MSAAISMARSTSRRRPILPRATARPTTPRRSSRQSTQLRRVRDQQAGSLSARDSGRTVLQDQRSDPSQLLAQVQRRRDGSKPGSVRTISARRSSRRAPRRDGSRRSPRVSPGLDRPPIATRSSGILDSNGNVEVQDRSACTSGSGIIRRGRPRRARPLSDNTCTWLLATIGGDSARDRQRHQPRRRRAPSFGRGAGLRGNNTPPNDGASNNPGGPNDGALTAYHTSLSSSISNLFLQMTAAAFAIIIGMEVSGSARADQRSSIGFTQYTGRRRGLSLQLPTASSDIGSSASLATDHRRDQTASLTVDKTHHVALTYDGSTLVYFSMAY